MDVRPAQPAVGDLDDDLAGSRHGIRQRRGPQRLPRPVENPRAHPSRLHSAARAHDPQPPQELRLHRRARRRRLRDRRGGDRALGPERRGQDDAPPDPPRPPARERRGARDGPRPVPRAARRPCAHRLHARERVHDPGPLRRGRGRVPRPARRDAAPRRLQARARGDVLRRPRRGALPRGVRVLDGHAAAAEARGGARARPRAAHARRADERPRPQGPRGDAHAPPRARDRAQEAPAPLVAPPARRRARLHGCRDAAAGADRPAGADHGADLRREGHVRGEGARRRRAVLANRAEPSGPRWEGAPGEGGGAPRAGADTATIFRAAQAAQAQVRGIKAVRRTLENVFLDAVDAGAPAEARRAD